MNIEKELFTKEEVLYEKIRMINRILDNPNATHEIVKELMDEILYHKEEQNKILKQQYQQKLEEILSEQQNVLPTIKHRGEWF